MTFKHLTFYMFTMCFTSWCFKVIVMFICCYTYKFLVQQHLHIM